MRVLLLNPPGQRTYIRDYSCSKTTKSNYLFHPIDLVVLSGTVAARHETTVLDCMAERLDPPAAERRIDAAAPEVIISLVGSVSWAEDRAFLAGQAARGRRIVAIGDVLQEDAARRLAEEPWLEAVLHHFASDAILDYLEGPPHVGGSIRHMSLRGAHGAPLVGEGQKLHGAYRVPRPRHELFPRTGYRFSFARAADFATVLTDYGCPYPCTFCIANVYYGKKLRHHSLDYVIGEIETCMKQYGIKDFLLWEEIFTLDKEFGIALCDEIIRKGLDIEWATTTRADQVNEEILLKMKEAGCQRVYLGLESGNQTTLELMNKSATLEDGFNAVQQFRAAGIEVGAFFIVGYPGETIASIEETFQLALALPLDYISFNVPYPLPGSKLFERVSVLDNSKDWSRENEVNFVYESEFDEQWLRQRIDQTLEAFAEKSK